MKEKEALILKFDELSVSRSALEETLGAQDLFGGSTVVVLDSVLEKTDVEDYLMDLLPEMKESKNKYYLLAGALTAALEKRLERVADRVIENDLKEGKPKEEYGAFQLADAFAKRDRKAAWVLFIKACMRGSSPQELCGTLVWQMRMVVLAYTTDSAKDAGVSDFPYRKAKSAMKYFSQREAEDMLGKLIGLYHFDPKINRGDTMVALERVILSL